MGESIVLAIVTTGSATPVTAFTPIATTARTIASSMIQASGSFGGQPIRVWSQQSDTINAPGSPGDQDIANFTFALSGAKELATPLDRCGTTIPDAHKFLGASFTPKGPIAGAGIDITIRLV